VRSAFIGLGYAWPVVSLAGALGILLCQGHSPPSDRAVLLSLFSCFLAVPVQVWHLHGCLPAGWDVGFRFLASVLLAVAATLATTAVAMLLFIYALFFTGLYGE
jgi:hypothetical protein